PVQVEKAQARQRLGIAADAPVVLFLGRIHEKKNIHLIIRAFELVRASNPECLLIIAGGRTAGKYVSQLDALVAQLGLESSVRWLGFVDEETKPDVFSASDVFVHAEEHTSELQSRENLVCRLLLEKKKKKNIVYEKEKIEKSQHMIAYHD